MISTKPVISVAVITVLVSVSTSLQAAPLPGGTLLAVDAAANPDASGKCQAGSCYGMEVSPNFWIWTTLAPGVDGGFIVGKNQLSGGQETGPSGTNSSPGDITAAWSFFGAYGSSMADNTLNVFSDTSNDGVTILNDINLAWNGGVIPLGNGSINDYSITLDGNGGGSYSMEFTVMIPDGPYAGVNVWWVSRGNVTVPPTNEPPPPVEDIAFTAVSGENTVWAPIYIDDGTGGVYVCAITANASNGNATVSPDCSSGTYTSGVGYEGIDMFTYSVTNDNGLLGMGNVSVLVEPPQEPLVCDFPIVSVSTVGGGQSPAVNSTVTTTFTGHITTEAGLTTGGKNVVKICKGSTLDFMSTSTVGSSTCLINGALIGSSGTVTAGDKLICTNKPDASDTDRFSIKSGM